MNNKKKIIVTGGAGFIGSNLTDELVRLGYEVHIIDNLSAGKKENINPKAKLHIKDITKLKEIENLFKGIDFVFHLAALPRVQFSIEHPSEANDANVTGTVNVLIASQKAGVKKVIYSASSSAYGDQKIMPLRENMMANPKSPYGLQKHIGELYCKVWSDVYGLPTVSLRYFNVYGPRNNAEGAYALVIAKFIKQKQNNEVLTITGNGKQTRDFTHVRDVVKANMLAMKSKKVGKGEVINIGAGRNISINSVAKMINGSSKYIPARLEPKDTLADNKLAKKLLKWQPSVKIEEGIVELKRLAGI
ncbi:MAG TPA: NAD-dependent epimerase/dehydratase family protein [Candidatus Paceibacterota bacterium]